MVSQFDHLAFPPCDQPKSITFGSDSLNTFLYPADEYAKSTITGVVSSITQTDAPTPPKSTGMISVAVGVGVIGTSGAVSLNQLVHQIFGRPLLL